MQAVAVGAPSSTLQAHNIELNRSVHKRTIYYAPLILLLPCLVLSYDLHTLLLTAPPAVQERAD